MSYTPSTDEFVTIRGLNVPRQEVENMKAEFGATLVPDGEMIGGVLVVTALDAAMKRYRATRGKDPDLVNLREDPFHWYKPCRLRIRGPLGIMVPVNHLWGWFRLPRIFQGVQIAKH